MNVVAERPRVSVCMAAYNGEPYIHEQVASVLPQLATTDELIVVDDCSSDGTGAAVQAFGDSRIRLYRNERNEGVVRTFQRAMRLARGEFIVLCDQDDRWTEGRVAALVDALRTTGALVVSSNSEFMDAAGRKIPFAFARLAARDSHRHLTNIGRIFMGTAPYSGCAMAFRRSMTDMILPIPRFVESHDLWIAMASNLLGSNAHLEQITLVRRVHGNNVSIVRRSLYRKLRSRLIFALSAALLLIRRRSFLRRTALPAGAR
jgi:glycosyltransferase involved in cell wall biosynthesis